MTTSAGCKCDLCHERWIAHQKKTFGRGWPHNLDGVPTQGYWDQWPGLLHRSQTVVLADEAVLALPDCPTCGGDGKTRKSDLVAINTPSRAELWGRIAEALSILGHRNLLPATTRDELVRVLRGESVAVADPKEAG